MDNENTIPLPDKCCARCMFWKPNRVTDFKDGDEKTCWKHNEAREDESFCSFFVGSDAIEVNVPQITNGGIMIERNRKLEGNATEILIVTYGTPTMRCSGKIVSELEWLEYCLKTISKHCKGFQGITVAHPNHETNLFLPFKNRFDIRLYGYDEVPKKGFLQHQAVMASADLFLPKQTTHVLHVDADCCCVMETTPMDYFYNDKPIYIWMPYDSLIESDRNDPTKKIIQDNYQWREPGDLQLGFKSSAFCMTRHPTIYPIEFYPEYRAHLEKVHGKPILQYFIEGKNDHPQNRLDFTTMGSYCFEKLKDKFHWFNVDDKNYPIDRFKARWSHGGISEQDRKEMEGYLNA